MHHPGRRARDKEIKSFEAVTHRRSITFIYLQKVLDNMSDQTSEQDKINKIRRHIDRTDIVIITALAERIQLIHDIAQYKKKKELPIYDEAREIEIMNRLKGLAKEQGLEESFTEEIFLSVFNEAKRIQNDIING